MICIICCNLYKDFLQFVIFFLYLFLWHLFTFTVHNVYGVAFVHMFIKKISYLLLLHYMPGLVSSSIGGLYESMQKNYG